MGVFMPAGTWLHFDLILGQIQAAASQAASAPMVPAPMMPAPTVSAAAVSPPVDSNLFYYSYSTIAQTLAGAFGFLAAVVLYRLQALSNQIQTSATQLIGDPAK